MFDLFAHEPSRNIRCFTWYYTITGLTFTLPIWVVFYLRVISLEQIALCNAIGMYLGIILQIPTGALADLVGRKVMVVIGQAIRAFIFLFLPFAGNFTLILITNLVSYTGEAMGSGADSALLYDSLKAEGREDEFGKIYAKILTLYRICLITGSLIGGLSYSLWYGTPYIMRGLALLASAYFISTMIEPKRTVVKFKLSSYYQKTISGILELAKSSFVKKLSLYYIAVGGITWACLTYFNTPFANDFGWTTNQMSYIVAAAYIISSSVVLYITNHKSLLNRQRVYLGFPILMVIALLPAIFVGKWLALVLMVIIQIAGSSRYSLLDRYVNMEFDSEHRATALSALNMLVSIVVATLIFAGGKIQGFSDTRTVYTLLGIITLIFVAPMALILVADHRRHKASTISVE